MLNFLRSKLSDTVYVQIWENRLKATNVESQECFDEKPLLAIATDDTGQESVSAIGNAAVQCNQPNMRIVNPFSHPRVLFSDFNVGEKMLQHVFSLLHKHSSLLKPAPIVVIHPMEKLEGGLTGIEDRAFRELAYGAGAREVHIHQGEPLSIQNFDISQVSEKETMPIKTNSGIADVIFYGVIIATAVYYAIKN